MPPALAALTLSPDEIRSASSEVGQRLVLRGILPPDVPTRGVPGQVMAGIQRGAFGVGATFGDALGVMFPDTGKGITDFFKSYQMQSSGGMIEQAAETATQSLGILGAVAGGLAVGGVPALTGVGLGTLSAVATPAVFGLAQATQTRDLLQAINQEAVKRGAKELTAGEIATAMATNGAIEYGGEFLSELLLLGRFFPGSTAFKGAMAGIQRYVADPATNASVRAVARTLLQGGGETAAATGLRRAGQLAATGVRESVAAGLREAPEEFVQNLGEAAVTRGIVGPERLRMAQEAGLQVPGTPVEEGLQAAKIALVAGPFFAAGGAASSRLLRGRGERAETTPPPPQGTPASDIARGTTPAPTPAPAPLVVPEGAPGPEPTPSAPERAPYIPGLRRDVTTVTGVNPLTGEGIAIAPQPAAPAGTGELVNPLTGETVASTTPAAPLATPEQAARYAEAPVLGIRPRPVATPQAGVTAAVEPAPPGTTPAQPQQVNLLDGQGNIVSPTPVPILGTATAPDGQSLVRFFNEATQQDGYWPAAQVAPVAAPSAAAPPAPVPPAASPRSGVPTQEAGEPAPVPPAAPVVSPAQAAMQADLVSALRNMGYTARDAQAAAETAMAQHPGSFEDALRLALAPRAAGLARTEAPRAVVPQEAPPVAPVVPAAEAVPPQQREASPEAPPAPAGPTTLAEPSQQLEQQGAATQAQIQREGLEVEAGTRLRPTVEQAPPTGGVEEPLGFLRRVWQRTTPGGDRPDASLTTKLQGQAIDARLQHVAAGETIISLTAREPGAGRVTTIPGVLRPEGSIEVVRAIVPHAMVEQLRTTGVVAFEGQTLRAGRAGMHDLATLGQLVRDPEVEHLHYLLTDADGRVLRVIEVSSRLPASAAPFVKEPGKPLTPGFMNQEVRKLQELVRHIEATGLYILHNHPSGDPTPSQADRSWTARMAAIFPGFQGHVVINSGRYAVINPAGEVSQAEIDTGRPDPFLQPSLGRAYTNVEIKTTADAAWIGAALAQPNFVTVVLVHKRPQGPAKIVRGVVLVPETAITQPHAEAKAYLEALQSEFGASLVTAFYDGSNRTVQIATEMLYRDGVLADAVTVLPQGTASSLAEEAPELAPSREAIAARRLTEAGAERVEEEAPVIRTQAQWKARVDEAIQQLPPVAEGHVRLYRGEEVPGRPSAGSPVADWIRDTPEHQAMLQATGRWFSTSTDDAAWYLRHNADIGPGRVGPVRLAYIDVPQAVADEGRLANQPAEIRRFARRPDVEYFVPREYAARATVVPFGEGGVQEEAPTLPTPPRGPAVRDLPNTIAGVTVAQAGKLATAYRMMFDVGDSLHSSHLQQPLAEATFRKLRITWPQMEAIGQETLLRWLAHPDELHALRERFRLDPTATMSNAENAAWTQLTTALMDDLDVKRSLGEIDQATFDQEFDQLIKNDLLMPGASSLGRGLAMQRQFQQVGAYRLADFLARLEKKQGKALTDEGKRQEARTFMDILRSGDRDAIRQQLEQTTDPTLLDYYMELYYGSLLSGLPTLNINALGTLAHITFQKFVVGPTAVGLDWMISGFSGHERQRYMQEVFADWNATWKNAGQQYREAWYWWKAPFPRAVRGEEPVGVPPPERLAQGLGMTRAHVLDLTGAEAFSRAPLQNADGTPHRWGPLLRRLAPFVGAASRVLAATDAVASNMAFDGAVAKLATRQGIQQFGVDNQEQVHNFVEHVKTHLPLFPEIEAAAKAEAKSNTFNDPAGGLARAILGARQAPQPFGVFFRLLTPFANTPDRLLARGLELVPVLGLPVGMREAGYTTKGFLADFRTGEPRAVEIAAKQVVGLMLASMAAVMWDRDLLTGPLPVDPAERQAWERQGKLPGAIRLGDNWVEYRRVEPFISIPFGAMTAGFQAIKTLQQERAKQGLLLDASSMEDISAIGTGVAFNLVKFLLDSSYFSGLANFFGSITRTSEGFATGLTQQLVSATLPLSGLLRNVNRSLEASGWLGTEPGVVLMRQRESVGEAYSRAIPGLATATRTRLNVSGRPVVSEEPLLGAVGGLLSPIRRRLASDDPVEAVFEQLQFHPGRPPRRQLETTVGRRLEDEEYNAYVTRRGELAWETLERIVALPFFAELPPDRQLARIKQTFSAATRRARREVFGQPETVQERRERFAAAHAAAE